MFCETIYRRSHTAAAHCSAITALLLLSLLSCGSFASTPAMKPQEISLPTAEPSNIPVNDCIWFRFYPAVQPQGQRAPGVVMLHALGSSEKDEVLNQLAHYLARRGINCAVMCLPYHGRRNPPGELEGIRFTDRTLSRAAQAYSQSASDLSTILTWLGQQSSVDSGRLGIVGVSVGAIIAHLCMGKDSRLSAGVAMLGAGDLADLRRASWATQVPWRHYPGKFDPDAEEDLRRVDPLTYAKNNQPRHVLMVQAARDLVMVPRDAIKLWNALDHPPIQWIDTNHYALSIVPATIFGATAEYLFSVWNGPSRPARHIPRIYAPTLKLGMVMGLNTLVTPAIQWQALSFAWRRDHLSLLHADLGVSGRGLFAGLAFTLNPFVDLGVARRLYDSHIYPYASLHLVL